MSEERKAIYYGQVKLIPGILCDSYVLDDGAATLSERGAADLLGVDQKLLNRMRTNWPPKTLRPFINAGSSMRTNSVEVTAENSPYKGRKIVVYTVEIIEMLIAGYAFALAYRALRKNQRHIGERCTILAASLIRTALDAAIKEACGLPLNIQATAQQHFIDIVKMTRDLGLKCSVEDDIVIKKDMLEFLGITMGKLNGHLRKHREHIKAIPLTRRQIWKTGSRASHMKGFPINDAVKIILGMDSVPGILLKEQLFGPLGIFVKPDTSKEIQWEAKLSTAFNGFGFYHNYPFGPYRIDFLIGDYKVVLECNGYEHRYYNAEREKQREELITREYGLVRFNHNIDLETLINAILRVKPGEVIRLS